MIELVIAILVAIVFSIDGIMALFSVQTRQSKMEVSKTNTALKTALVNMDLNDEIFHLKQRKGGIAFPQSVLKKGGFTGRGSPFLTRNEYTTLESVEKSIKRIVRR